MFLIFPPVRLRRIKVFVPEVPTRIRNPGTSLSLISICPETGGLRPRSFASVSLNALLAILASRDQWGPDVVT
jgi:hypothetical protein